MKSKTKGLNPDLVDNFLLRISFVCPTLLPVISDIVVIEVNNDKNGMKTPHVIISTLFK